MLYVNYIIFLNIVFLSNVLPLVVFCCKLLMLLLENLHVSLVELKSVNVIFILVNCV